MPSIDAPVVKSASVVAAAKADDRVYVEVPEDDIFEQRHPDIIINGVHYGPGKHYVSAELAGTISDRVRSYLKSQTRLNSSRPDAKAQGHIDRFVSRNGSFVNPSSLS